jgi:hypothetical protein
MSDTSLAKLAEVYKVQLNAKEEARYFEAIGRFIVAYAAAESNLHAVARKLSGLKDDKARVLFAGMRLGDVVSRTRGLLRISKRKPSIRADIEACLTQLDVIGTERDKLVHRYLYALPGKGIRLSNEMTAKSLVTAEEHVFSEQDLLKLQLDCYSIVLRLSHVCYPAFRQTVLYKESKQALYAPWQYKPASPKTQTSNPHRRRLVEALQRQPEPPHPKS